MQIRSAKNVIFFLPLFTAIKLQSQIIAKPLAKSAIPFDELVNMFIHPPETAKPGVLWMWMGSNISKEGITKDLEALKQQGFNRTTIFFLRRLKVT